MCGHALRVCGLVRALVLCALALTFASACTAPRLFYERLDWFVWWKISGYAALDAAQQKRFDADFAALWEWHRKDVLPRYVSDLRTLAQASQRPLDETQLAGWVDRIDAHWNAVVSRGAPDACRDLAALSDAQVASTLQRVDRNIAADEKEYVLPPESEVRAARDARLLRTLERWLGDLDAAQRTRLARWNAARQPIYGAWLEQRRHWRTRFASAMAQRRSPGFCAQLTPLMQRPAAGSNDGLVTRFDVERSRWIAFLAELSKALTPAQRDHLRTELLALGDDFAALANEKAG